MTFVRCSFLILVIILSIGLSGCADNENNTITVSAAASLGGVFDELADEFEQANPGTSVNVNYASSGILRTQIEQGAPVDVFASASIEHMDILQTKEIILINSRTNFARNSLVLIVPRNSDVNTTLENLKYANHIALGDPSHVPAGRYAKETLESIDLWPELEDKTIYTTNVKQVLDYVSRGEVDAGFVYATDVTGSVNVARKVPNSLHTPIIYTAAVLKESKHPETAARFVQFVTESDETLAQYGFISIKDV